MTLNKAEEFSFFLFSPNTFVGNPRVVRVFPTLSLHSIYHHDGKGKVGGKGKNSTRGQKRGGELRRRIHYYFPQKSMKKTPFKPLTSLCAKGDEEEDPMLIDG